MKQSKHKGMAAALALVASAVLSGCGSSGGGGASVVVAPSNTSGGCVSISQTIGFTASSLQYTNTGVFYAGIIPNDPSASPALYIPPGTYSSTGIFSGNPSTNTSSAYNYSDSGISGNIYVSISPQSTGASMSGYLTLTPAAQEDALYNFENEVGAGINNSTYNLSNLCVSGIAISGYGYYPGNSGLTANVYLYLNSTVHGYIARWY